MIRVVAILLIVAGAVAATALGVYSNRMAARLSRFDRVCLHVRDRLCLDWHMIDEKEASRRSAIEDIDERAPEIEACVDPDAFSIVQFDAAAQADHVDAMRTAIAKAIINLTYPQPPWRPLDTGTSVVDSAR
jgi:hypothetical protein